MNTRTNTHAHKPQPSMVVRPHFNPPKCDPVTRAERDNATFNPNIGNNGESLYNAEAFALVHRYETEDEKQVRENKESGYGEVDNVQAYIMMECRFDYLYEEDDWLTIEKDEFSLYLQQYYGYEDDGMSCKFNPSEMDPDEMDEIFSMDNPEGIGESLRQEAILGTEEDIEQDKGMEATVSAEEPSTNQNAEAPAIETNVNLSSSFANAVEAKPESVEPQSPDLEQAPSTPPPTPPAANAHNYQLSA